MKETHCEHEKIGYLSNDRSISNPSVYRLPVLFESTRRFVHFCDSRSHGRRGQISMSARRTYFSPLGVHIWRFRKSIRGAIYVDGFGWNSRQVLSPGQEPASRGNTYTCCLDPRWFISKTSFLLVSLLVPQDFSTHCAWVATGIFFILCPRQQEARHAICSPRETRRFFSTSNPLHAVWEPLRLFLFDVRYRMRGIYE